MRTFHAGMAVLAAFALGGCASAPPAPPAPGGPAALLGRAWALVGIDYADATTATPGDPQRYTLRFRDDGSVEVVADCNRGRGHYALDGGVLRVDGVATTRKACGPGSLDAQFLAGLHAVRSFELREDDVLILDGGPEGGTLRLRAQR